MSSPVALVAWGHGQAALRGDGLAVVGPWPQLLPQVVDLEARRRPRWVWWAASRDAQVPVSHGVALQRCWDVAEVHRLLHGGWAAGPALAWAAAAGLPPSGLSPAPADDLFGAAADGETDGGQPLDRTGYLRPQTESPRWCSTPDRAQAWAELALRTAAAQLERLDGARAVATAHSESAAALLCLELERDGLPVDRRELERLLEQILGPRPADPAEAQRIRTARDAAVLRHTPGRETTDLRNPAQVRDLLAGIGVVVPDTRKWRLEPYRHSHPAVAALLEWRAAERIATTYGYAWLDAHVGPDDRLRGGWTACDGAAGRMAARHGLHNLPARLRDGVAAAPGHLLVRADLGQIEPRVLAAVSGDEAFAAATRADDLYAPVAAALGVERAAAKVAVLAAMYGQRSGTAGRALAGLERTYPVAMGYLDGAYAEGAAGRAVRTFGGRRVPMWTDAPDTAAAAARDRDAARGRFARNAVVQGSAAELFKAWAATVRHTTADLGARIVLCLHDELLLHVPAEAAGAAAERVEQALVDSARRWTGSDRVRFVADTSVVHRWPEALG
ncbi:MAG TPA: DNA polymerase [Dermatophilaceae bacterium]|nr:DNA polymerase [Dermatophilaceae bacterium]